MDVNMIIQGNSLEELRKLPGKCVNCVITSPPYWALREYHTDEQVWDGKQDCEHEFNVSFCVKCGAWRGNLGLEPTPDLYIKHLCDIFDEIKRVLRDDGTCWVNMGDTYSTTTRWTNPLKDSGLPDKCLVQIPSRFSIEMVNRGWILRNEIIWYKRACMPSSVSDRFTIDFEKIFFFVKNQKYYFEQQHESFANDSRWKNHAVNSINGKDYNINNVQSAKQLHTSIYSKNEIPTERNMRCVWDITTHPFKGAHFATFPESLVLPMLKAGCPEFVCKKCEKPKEVKEVKEVIHGRVNDRPDAKVRPDNFERIPSDWKPKKIKEIKEISCDCGVGFKSGVVLDPFFGTGTTGLVALKNNRDFIGIELSPEYVKIAKKRLKPFLKKLAQAIPPSLEAQ